MQVIQALAALYWGDKANKYEAEKIEAAHNLFARIFTDERLKQNYYLGANSSEREIVCLNEQKIHRSHIVNRIMSFIFPPVVLDFHFPNRHHTIPSSAQYWYFMKSLFYKIAEMHPENKRSYWYTSTSCYWDNYLEYPTHAREDSFNFNQQKINKYLNLCKLGMPLPSNFSHDEGKWIVCELLFMMINSELENIKAMTTLIKSDYFSLLPYLGKFGIQSALKKCIINRKPHFFKLILQKCVNDQLDQDMQKFLFLIVFHVSKEDTKLYKTDPTSITMLEALLKHFQAAETGSTQADRLEPNGTHGVGRAICMALDVNFIAGFKLLKQVPCFNQISINGRYSKSHALIIAIKNHLYQIANEFAESIPLDEIKPNGLFGLGDILYHAVDAGNRVIYSRFLNSRQLKEIDLEDDYRISMLIKLLIQKGEIDQLPELLKLPQIERLPLEGEDSWGCLFSQAINQKSPSAVNSLLERMGDNVIALTNNNLIGKLFIQALHAQNLVNIETFYQLVVQYPIPTEGMGSISRAITLASSYHFPEILKKLLKLAQGSYGEAIFFAISKDQIRSWQLLVTHCSIHALPADGKFGLGHLLLTALQADNLDAFCCLLCAKNIANIPPQGFYSVERIKDLAREKNDDRFLDPLMLMSKNS